MRRGSAATGAILIAAALLLPVAGWRLSVKAYNDDHAVTQMEELVNAAGAGKLDKMSALINSGVRVNEDSDSAAAPLMAAVSSGKTRAVSLLISNGARINRKYRSSPAEKRRIERARYSGQWLVGEGDTALLVSTGTPNIEVAQLLITNGADVKAVDDRGNSAVALAMQANANPSLVKLLVQKGAPIAATDGNGDSALMWAISKLDANLAMELIRHGANVNTINVFRETALVQAVRTDIMPDVALKLAHLAADVNQLDTKGESALSYAVTFGHEKLAKVLLDRGARLNQPVNGSTVLINAAVQGNTPIVRMLLVAGADTGAKDKNGMTALTWAKAKGNNAAAAALAAAGSGH